MMKIMDVDGGARLVFSSLLFVVLLESFSTKTALQKKKKKKKHVLLGSTGHDAYDPLRGSGEEQK